MPSAPIQISITDDPSATMLTVDFFTSDGRLEIGNLDSTVIASATLPADATDDDVRACVKHAFTFLGERIPISRSDLGPVERTIALDTIYDTEADVITDVARALRDDHSITNAQPDQLGGGYVGISIPPIPSAPSAAGGAVVTVSHDATAEHDDGRVWWLIGYYDADGDVVRTASGVDTYDEFAADGAVRDVAAEIAARVKAGFAAIAADDAAK